MPDVDRSLVADAAAYADRWLAHQRRLREIPGLAAAIRVGQELVLSTAHGHAHLERGTALTNEHLFRVASHSKWFTATGVMILREHGRLRLDDPLERHIPWLGGRVGAVTVRQALNHAGGLTRDGADHDHWQLLEPFPDQERLQTLAEHGDVLPANQILKYSNIGFSLLGLVIEAASGEPYNEFMRKAVVEPLGLHNTGPETDAGVRARLVTGYTSRNLLFPRFPLPDVETGAMSAATGFYSTAEDLTRFAAAAALGNDELLSDESKREMQRAYWQVQDIDNYGLGMQIQRVGSRALVGHGGSFPGHATRTLLDPESAISVSVLTNETNAPANLVVKAVFRLIDLALEQQPAPAPGDLDRFTGQFANLWGYLDIVRLGDRLFFIDPAAEDPAGFAFKLEIIDENTLRIEERAGYGFPGEVIRYVRDADGAVSKLDFTGSTAVPVEPDGGQFARRRDELLQLRN